MPCTPVAARQVIIMKENAPCLLSAYWGVPGTVLGAGC